MGTSLGYTIRLSNTGAEPAGIAVLVDSLPVAWSGTMTPAPSASSHASPCTLEAETVVCAPGTLRHGASLSVHLVARTVAQACGAPSSQLSDEATLTADAAGNPLAPRTAVVPRVVLASRCTAHGRVDYGTGRLATRVSVGLCPRAGSTSAFPDQGCATGATDARGHFSIAVPPGTYRLSILAYGGKSTASVTGPNGTLGVASMPAIDPVPRTVTITTPFGTTTHTTSTPGTAYVPLVIPSHRTRAATTITRTGCAGATSHTFEFDQVLGVKQTGALTLRVVTQGTLEPISADPSRYVASFVAPATPSDPARTLVGAVVISTTLRCPGATSPVQATFSAYIDPSGVVLDSAGQPVDGATVVLYRKGATGNFTAVPATSPVLSPTTRKNPQRTGVDGVFGWTVQGVTYTRSWPPQWRGAPPPPPPRRRSQCLRHSKEPPWSRCAPPRKAPGTAGEALGYRFATADGGVFDFGGAPFFGCGYSQGIAGRMGGPGIAIAGVISS